MLISSPLKYLPIVVMWICAMNMPPLKPVTGIFKYNIFYCLNNLLVRHSSLAIEENTAKNDR
jgi:hypothetical protein